MKGVEYIDSNQFCGTTCHVMEPEWTAYQRSVSYTHLTLPTTPYV